RDFLARHGARVADLLAARDARGEVAACALPDLARLCADLDLPPPPAFERLRPLVDDFRGIPPAALPADLAAELRAYQRAGVDWLAFLRDAGLGALLADDMGLGKTLQTLCALRGRALVVAPTSVLGNWRDEAARFRPGLRVALYHGPARALDPAADVTLTSYALLRLDADALAAVDWDAVVLDEAQQIKNPESQAAQAAFRLRAQQRVALTGTPVENRLEELWSLLHFLNPGLLGGRADFRERVARPVANGDAEAASRLRERIAPFVLRRLKRDVARELPPRTDVVLRFALSDEERAVYDAVRAAGLAAALDALRAGGSLMPALEVLLRLRQAACDAALVPGVGAPPASSKLELLVARLEEARDDDHRALVFSQWTSLLDRIAAALDAAGIPWVRLDGATRDRDAVVARFQAGEVPVMLVSLRAGGTGLNLTAADHVFLVDPWWNPAVEQQAADRAHRIGQTRPVVVHRLVAQDTVEERILALHESKRALALAALGEGGDDATAAGLTREDLLALLD
ncbi:MAG: DEAD/DEAH box helicase, partial [Myxococcales bacterium]|nr:DEAD/DEAH box helicase [Myxococcales bacterium]